MSRLVSVESPTDTEYVQDDQELDAESFRILRKTAPERFLIGKPIKFALRFLSVKKPKTLVTTILIVINVLVYAMWVGWIPVAQAYGSSFMPANFLVSWNHLTDGRWWVLLTSVFSHSWALHLILNMFVLNSFGRFLESFLGARFYIGFFLVAGIISSLCHATVSAFLMGSPELPALGASGAIAGLVLLFSLIFPKEKIVLFGLIPVPALVGALAFVGLDIWGLVSQVEGGGLPIGHGAHLGGSLTGLLTYFFVVKPRLRRANVDQLLSHSDEEPQA